MLRPEVIRKRINKLNEYLDFLEKAQHYQRDLFMKKPEYYASTERFLQLSIESINDMGSHVIASEGLGNLNQYSDIPELFADNGWIDETTKELWLKMIGFRNILVHDYLEVDREAVYEILQQNVGDLKKLRNIFARFL